MRAGRPRSLVGASSHHSCSSRGRAPACRAAAVPMRQSRHAWWPFVVLRVTPWITPFLFPASRLPCNLQEIRYSRIVMPASSNNRKVESFRGYPTLNTTSVIPLLMIILAHIRQGENVE